MNELTPLQRGHLRTALVHLAHKDVHRYRHHLWIGFGDTWPTLDRKLVQAGHIRENLAPSPVRALTDLGVSLAESLDGSTVAA